MDRPLVVLDCETAAPTGAPHLVELAAVRVEDGEIQDSFHSLICPPVEVHPESFGVHGIGADQLRTAPWASQVLPEFTAWVGADWMAAHNAGADTRILGFEYARAGLEPPPGPFLDSLALSHQFVPESPDHKLDTLRGHLDLEEGEGHRALTDAVHCWKVLEECFERAGGLHGVQLSGHLPKRPLTIAGRQPRGARMSPRLRPLERAIAEDVPVILLYALEDAAAVPIEVHPRFLYQRNGKSYLEGECLRSSLLKTYLLERIRKVLPAE
ncbi:MAG: exonuclease domain-containing protein [Planctomycetota bacterium]|nr:exonuclease domain-containing protein [Planctomycetota bacterium]